MPQLSVLEVLSVQAGSSRMDVTQDGMAAMGLSHVIASLISCQALIGHSVSFLG